MALLAIDGDEPIHARLADEKKTYACIGCRAPVRIRKGVDRQPHFYHPRSAPSCRLYSKSQDHALVQAALQALLPPGEALLEQPLLPILRIADVLWEKRKLAFEIQCSDLTPYEVERRTEDYAKARYQIVWLLHDKVFNRRTLRPAEPLLRQLPCYYVSIPRQGIPTFYDQFELIEKEHRIKRIRRLKVHLNAPLYLTRPSWDPAQLPSQILRRAASHPLYFKGDLIYKATLAHRFTDIAFLMQNFCALERLYLNNRSSKLKNLMGKLKSKIQGWMNKGSQQ